MLISRYLLRGAISGHYVKALTEANRLIDRDGAIYLLSLRLVHVIPSWLINLLLGWTNIRLTTFWWATQLGTLPATLLYAYLGATLSVARRHAPGRLEGHHYATSDRRLRLAGSVAVGP